MNTTKTDNKNPSTEEVRFYIQQKIEESFDKGEKEIVIRAGDIHEELSMHKAWKAVCDAMRKLEPFYEYKILFTPDKKNGANLKYIYSQKSNSLIKNKKNN